VQPVLHGLALQDLEHVDPRAGPGHRRDADTDTDTDTVDVLLHDDPVQDRAPEVGDNPGLQGVQADHGESARHAPNRVRRSSPDALALHVHRHDAAFWPAASHHRPWRCTRTSRAVPSHARRATGNPPKWPLLSPRPMWLRPCTTRTSRRHRPTTTGSSIGAVCPAQAKDGPQAIVGTNSHPAAYDVHPVDDRRLHRATRASPA